MAASASPADRVALVVYGATAEVIASLLLDAIPESMERSSLTC